MARQIQFQGQVEATPSAATILIDGVQVFSGQVGAGLPLNADLTLATISVDNPANVQSTISVSVAVTSGIVRVGSMVADCGNPNFGNILTNDQKATIGLIIDETGNFYGSGVERTNILINGQAPEYPATPVGFDPGPVNSPDWNGWRFEVSAGETLTCTVTIPPQAVYYFDNL
jgi:hypothetical protein